MKVCYFGTYDRDHLRNRMMITGLTWNGVEVIECHTPYRGKLLTYLILTAQYLTRGRKADLVVVGAFAPMAVPLAWLLSRLTGKWLVFDALVSIYDTFVSDRQTIAPHSLKARLYYWIDRMCCRCADVVLLDTEEHIDYFCTTFNQPRAKFRAVLVGSDIEIAAAGASPAPGPLLVLFVGSFIPLHGIEHIVHAAKHLERQQDIRICLAGRGQTFTQTAELVKELGLGNVDMIGPLSAQEYAAWLAKADVCLGVFGTSDKAHRVIPCKIFDAMAAAKPIITGDSPSIRRLLTDGQSCLLAGMGDAAELAEAILRLARDPALRATIAHNASEIFRAKATPWVIGRQVKELYRHLARLG